jgi:hypothetical protein
MSVLVYSDPVPKVRIRPNLVPDPQQLRRTNDFTFLKKRRTADILYFYAYRSKTNSISFCDMGIYFVKCKFTFDWHLLYRI